MPLIVPSGLSLAHAMQSSSPTFLSGFTRLSVAHGIGELLGVIRASQRIFEPLIAEHGGRILKFEGDSLMAIFPDPGQALTSIDALYLAADSYNAGRATHEKIRLCASVVHGDVLVAGEHDIFGLEVNWASLLGRIPLNRVRFS